MLSSSDLIDHVKSYEPTADLDLIKKAYLFAMDAHGMQKRASGIPYFSHPIEVAKILIDMKFDSNMIIAALLHDVVEDTAITIERIKSDFGDNIAWLVNGVTKLNKIAYTSAKEHQADNFRKFLLSISEDVRVLIIKLADRLHNMRTLYAVKDKEKRRRIAIETMDIYAPLAERIGMQAIKDELDDRAFFALYPDEYNAILVKLEQIRHKDANFINTVVQTLEKVLKEHNVDAIISGREKRPCSIWRKMCNQNVALDKLNDIMAFRIVVETVEECYKVLGIVHVMFPIIPGRFKDYISIPKLNNYRSLHTTVLGPYQQKIEVQIRTREMHQSAESGVAAHWSYKDGGVVSADNKNYKWLKNLISILENSNASSETVDESKLEMYENNVFCFTPNGDIISLPVGATCIDFAYSIHTSIGNKCVGCKVNGRVVPLKTVLQNGDQVEVLTSPYQKPDATWGKFVVTGKAKAGLKKYVKEREKIEFAKLGKMLTQRIFNRYGVHFKEQNVPIQEFHCESLNSFYVKVAKLEIPLHRLNDVISRMEVIRMPNEEGLSIFGLTPGVVIHFGSCCNPVPGDKIRGIMMPRTGLSVHTANCKALENKMEGVINLGWNNQGQELDNSFIARLKIVLLNKVGSLAQILQLISSKGVDVTNLKVESRSKDFYEIFIDIDVCDIAQLGEIQGVISTCSRVRTVRRA